MSATLSVRAIDHPAEFDAFFRLAARTFVRDSPVDSAAADWQRFMTEHPGFHPESLRGAFLGNTYVGGYIVEERWLRMGAAAVRAGCIGAVVTHPDYRRQGVGSALMWDAIDHARRRDLAILLLNGAPRFYEPFGYVDVFDPVEHAMARAEILAQPPSPYQMRPATEADAAALVMLYQRHYGPYTGSFARTLRDQVHILQLGQAGARAAAAGEHSPEMEPLVVTDAAANVRGYLAMPWGPLRAFGCEAAADDWPAALALLQGQIALSPQPPDHVRWRLPLDARTYYALADHLQVQSEARSRPHAGWMARTVDVPALIGSVLPAWQARWLRHAVPWAGTLEIGVGDDRLRLTVDPAGIRMAEQPTAVTARIRLSPGAFIQLLFGFRPADWLAGQAGQELPADLVPVIDALSPHGRTWIAPTDGC